MFRILLVGFTTFGSAVVASLLAFMPGVSLHTQVQPTPAVRSRLSFLPADAYTSPRLDDVRTFWATMLNGSKQEISSSIADFPVEVLKTCSSQDSSTSLSEEIQGTSEDGLKLQGGVSLNFIHDQRMLMNGFARRINNGKYALVRAVLLRQNETEAVVSVTYESDLPSNESALLLLYAQNNDWKPIMVTSTLADNCNNFGR